MEVLAGHFQPLGANRVNESGTGAAVWCPPGVTPDPEAFTAVEELRTGNCPPVWAMWRPSH